MTSFSFDLSDLTNNIASDVADIEARAADVAKKCQLDLHGELMLRTPVDTGQARNGWQMGGDGQVLTVENMVSYIGILNAGHSKQAPIGFVENAIDGVVGRLNR